MAQTVVACMNRSGSPFTLNVSTRHTKQPSSYTVAPPTAPCLDHWMQLSNLDTLMPPQHVPILVVYTKQAMQGFRFDDIVSRLEASLSRTLVAFYPFSGRLKHNDNSSCQLHLNNKGAEFTVMESELKLQDIEYYMPGSMQNMLVPSLHGCKDGTPPISIQVTRFKCGALGICCSFHHQLADGYGGTLFLKSWANMARNGALDDAPIHDRTSLLLPLTPSVPRRLPIFTLKGAPSSINPDQQTEVFLFDSSFIVTNKHSIMTTFETITSFMWQQIAKAQHEIGLDSQEELATVCFMVNGRKVMGLPTTFTGNASIPVTATCRFKELLHQPLSYVAERVRMATKEVTREYIMAAIAHCSLHEDVSLDCDHVMVSSCTRFPFYDMDFGWGKPTFAGFQLLPPGILEGALLYTPAPCGNGVVAHVQLDHRVMDCLMRNGRMRELAFLYKQLFKK